MGEKRANEPDEHKAAGNDDMENLKAELRRRIREFAPTVQESFEAFDVNGDGVISRTEFKEALVLLGMDVPDAERKRLRQQIDTTPDKKISFKDFEAFMLDGAPVEDTPVVPIEEPKPAGLEQPMADGEYDITGKPLPNNDTDPMAQFAARSESSSAVNTLAPATDPLADWEKRASVTDVHHAAGNDDMENLKAELRQRIREFAPTVQESFEAFDVNGDGVISRTEFKEALVLLGMDVTDAERKRLRQQIDTTPDKKISFKDFEAFMLDGAPVETSPAAPVEEPKPAGLEQPMADGEYDITGKPLPNNNTNPMAQFAARPASASVVNTLAPAVDPLADWEKRASEPDVNKAAGNDDMERLKAELRQRIREFAPTVQESFEAFDVNGDGVISRTEFKEALVLLGMDVTDAERKRLRQQIDTTPDKKISFKDFEAFCQGTAGW